MQKMLIAENDEMNRSLLYESFAGQYEVIQTEGSEELYRILTDSKEKPSIVLVKEDIAEHFTKEMVQTMSALKVFENIPVIIILNQGKAILHPQRLHLPFSDVVTSPVNPVVVKRRVGNLVSYFSNKQEMEQLVTKQTKKILEQNRELKEKQKKINSINNDMLDALSMVIEYRDVESGRHIHRIRKFTEVLLRVLAQKYPKYNLTEEKIELITSASSMHDIGKIAIPDSILLSPRRLTYEEFRIMKQHTIKGCEILDQLDSGEQNDYFRYCYDICRYHHEKYDGMGYPDGLVGDQIPIWAQVVSLADCYDALTSERTYKSAYSHEQAVEMIRTGACGAFSDEMMDCFSAVLPKFKALAIEYADVNHVDRSVSQRASVLPKDKDETDHSRDIYLKMDRDDLINTIEHQKSVIAQLQQHDLEVLYKTSDYVFEFDLNGDMLHQRKGSMKDICGYIPKNYEESVNILCECCEKDYQAAFLKTFRLNTIIESFSSGDERMVLECKMTLQGDIPSFVRITAVPLSENDKIQRIFLIITGLQQNQENRYFSRDRDIVTGLWNYTGIQKETDDYLQNAGKNGYHALMLIDIDDFRTVNRQAGYRYGNDILRDISNLLNDQVSGSNLLARIEDDNFVILVKDCPDRDERNVMIEDLFRCIHKTYLLGEEKIPDISSTIGIALYPNDGSSFEELFNNAARAVEIAKINGKNMFLYYNSSMREHWELKKYDTELTVQGDSEINSVSFDEYFIPVEDSAGEYILYYDMLGVNSGYLANISNFDELMTYVADKDNITALCLNNINKLLRTVYELEQEKTALPQLALYTAFRAEDCRSFLTALQDMTEEMPVDCSHICLMIHHGLVEQLSVAELSDFAGRLKELGFMVGIYQVGMQNININCFIEGMFDRIDFAESFIRSVMDGMYDIELLTGLMKYFDKQGSKCVFPMGSDEMFVAQIKKLSPCGFGVHQSKLVPLEEFKLQMKSPSVSREYPVLSHSHTSLVLNEQLYDEILERTGSFILEWAPRFDRVKFSGSFSYLYGYRPDTEDFIRHLPDNSFVHADDRKKLIEKLNAARSEESDSEAFIRIYSKTLDEYKWNRVHFVTIRNASGIPVRVIAVFSDITDSRTDGIDERRKDRTDFITNLYNKHAVENKIKSFLYDEGAGNGHALMIAEICGLEVLERSLGTVFANAVLKETAQNIRELFRDSDIIGRSSGNRFIVLVKWLDARQKIEEKAEQMCRIIRNKYQSDEGEIYVFGKTGISMFPRDGGTYDELYSAALKALYFAKHSIKKDAAFASDTDGSQKLLHD